MRLISVHRRDSMRTSAYRTRLTMNRRKYFCNNLIYLYFIYFLIARITFHHNYTFLTSFVIHNLVSKSSSIFNVYKVSRQSLRLTCRAIVYK